MTPLPAFSHPGSSSMFPLNDPPLFAYRCLCIIMYQYVSICILVQHRLGDFLRQSSHFSDERKFRILSLHSGVPTAKQRQVFARPPKGCRKVNWGPGAQIRPCSVKQRHLLGF